MEGSPLASCFYTDQTLNQKSGKSLAQLGSTHAGCFDLFGMSTELAIRTNGVVRWASSETQGTACTSSRPALTIFTASCKICSNHNHPHKIPPMAEIPNLAGIATQELVEQIGSGSFKASYINWSRTINLLHKHAPGWLVNAVPSSDGSLLHPAPVGAYLLISFVHTDGTTTPAVPQAVMDNRNNAIVFDKITARDITDTHRRGSCLAAALHFGLAHELWAKLPLESGYSETEQATQPPKVAKTAPKAAAQVKGSQQVTQDSFREACIERGLSTHAIEQLESIIEGDYAKGLAGLKQKTDEQILEINNKYAPATEDSQQW